MKKTTTISSGEQIGRQAEIKSLQKLAMQWHLIDIRAIKSGGKIQRNQWSVSSRRWQRETPKIWYIWCGRFFEICGGGGAQGGFGGFDFGDIFGNMGGRGSSRDLSLILAIFFWKFLMRVVKVLTKADLLWWFRRESWYGTSRRAQSGISFSEQKSLSILLFWKIQSHRTRMYKARNETQSHGERSYLWKIRFVFKVGCANAK